MKHPSLLLSAMTTAVLLAACGGGGDAPVETTPAPVAAAPSPSPTPAPAPTPTATCPPAQPASGFGKVLKSCNAGVAVFFDLTECVKDFSTGLTWQGQTPAGTGLRGNDKRFTNYDSTAETQKSAAASNGAAILVKPTQGDLDANTNSLGFRNGINNISLCGARNWRLPTMDEMGSILRPAESPTIDNAWFPNTSGEYWTSTPVAGSVTRTRTLFFGSGGFFSEDRDNSTSVRLVHD
jgi:hypothetical protein